MQSHDSPIKKGFIGESSYPPGYESGDVAISPNGNLNDRTYHSLLK